jgi:ABC-2 type transport system ATP-binding protein
VAEAKGVSAELAYRQVNEAMELTKITDVADRLIKTLSKGYKQRVGIAQALLGSPDVIILDEPTVGLDPKQIAEIRMLIRKLGETKTVIISSHILAEISEVCDHVIIISHGKIVADDSIKALEASVNAVGKLSVTAKCDADTAANILDGIDAVSEYTEERAQAGYCCFDVKFAPENDPAEKIFFAFSEKGIAITDMAHEHLTLEDIFLKLTEEAIPEAVAEEAEEDYTPQFSDENTDGNSEESEEENQ